MSPSVWGPIFWTTMHIVTLGYSPNPSQEEKIAASSFFNSLAHVIPCPICKTHYQHFLKEVPVENVVGSRDELINWCFELHNKVNEKLGKHAISFDQFIANMRSLSNMTHVELPPSSSTSMFVGALAIAGLFGIGYYVYLKQK
jgi:hypothetical protein